MAISIRTPFLNCKNRIEHHGRMRIRHMAREDKVVGVETGRQKQCGQPECGVRRLVQKEVVSAEGIEPSTY
jgi:hypothetical protein